MLHHLPRVHPIWLLGHLTLCLTGPLLMSTDVVPSFGYCNAARNILVQMSLCTMGTEELRSETQQPVFTPRLYYLLAVPLSELLNLRDWVFASEIWGKSGLWYIHNGMLFGFKRNEVLTHATTWMNLTDIIKVKEAWWKSHTAWWGP